MKDYLKWVDDDLREEKKRLKVPTPEQVALAKMLEDCGGDYHAFVTWTFRPNEFEEYGQQKDGEYIQNKRVSWLEGDKVVKRVTRNGG